MTRTYQCENCGNTFQAFPSDQRRFCSTRCFRNAPTWSKHGMSRTRLYAIWSHLKSRCSNSSNLAFEYYGGRGISVCEEWKKDFVAFKNWAMANGYEDRLEIDRIDPNEGYSPQNCRWANRGQQMQNTRKRRDAKTSRFKGVSFFRQNNNWRAQIHHGGSTTHLGLFDSEVDAALAYDLAARELFGEFANVNFPRRDGAKC